MDRINLAVACLLFITLGLNVLSSSMGYPFAPVSAPAPMQRWMLPVDFNGDGMVDLSLMNKSPDNANGEVSLLLGNGAGTFQPARPGVAA